MILPQIEIEVEAGDSLTFRCFGPPPGSPAVSPEDGGFGVVGRIDLEEIPADLMAALVALQQTAQVQAQRVLEVIPAQEWAYVSPLSRGAEIPPHYCKPAE